MKMRHGGLSLLKGGAFIIYGFLKLLPQQHKLVLISRLQSYSSVDFQHIAREAHQIDPSLKVVILNHKMNNRFLHVFAILQEMYHLATAQACVVESYVISVSILKHRKNLVIVQIWHALGAIKAFGHMTIDKPEGSPAFIARIMNMHKNYSYVTAGSPAAAEIFAKAFNVPRTSIIPIGMPRVDYLLDRTIQAENQRQIREYYHIPTSKKIILYAPTFRKGSKQIPYDELIANVNTDRFTLIIKPHPRDHSRIETKPGVIIDRHFELLKVLPLADFVITDYSATVFEAALLKKPLFFWAFDKSRYAERRGFALDYETEIPGFKSESIVDVLAAINMDGYNTEELDTFAKKHISVQDGSCTKKLFALMELAS